MDFAVPLSSPFEARRQANVGVERNRHHRVLQRIEAEIRAQARSTCAHRVLDEQLRDAVATAHGERIEQARSALGFGFGKRFDEQ